MIDYTPPFNPPKIHMEKTHRASPLEEALEEKRKVDTMRKKYNIKNPKDIRLPKMQWEGEDRS